MTAPEPRVPVIDMWAPFVPSAEVIDDLREGFPVELLSYFEVFTKTTISAVVSCPFTSQRTTYGGEPSAERTSMISAC